MEKKFRLPRKIKKKLSKGMYFYPRDEKTKTTRMVFPTDSQEEYDAVKNGIAKELEV